MGKNDEADFTIFRGAENRTLHETTNLLRAGCGVDTADTGYGLRSIGIDRSNRDRMLPQIERPTR